MPTGELATTIRLVLNLNGSTMRDNFLTYPTTGQVHSETIERTVLCDHRIILRMEIRWCVDDPQSDNRIMYCRDRYHLPWGLVIHVVLPPFHSPAEDRDGHLVYWVTYCGRINRILLSPGRGRCGIGIIVGFRCLIQVAISPLNPLLKCIKIIITMPV